MGYIHILVKTSFANNKNENIQEKPFFLMTCCEGKYDCSRNQVWVETRNSTPVKPSPNLTPKLKHTLPPPLPSAQAIQSGASGQCSIARYFSNLFWEFSALQTILFQFA